MLYEILIRATDLLQEISTISGSGKLTIGEDIPETQQNFEYYVAYWGDPSWTQDRVNDTKNAFTLTMPGYLHSQDVETGNRFTTRTFMMQYADLITAKFINRPRLENSSGQALNGVVRSSFTSGRIDVVAFPPGQQQLIRYRYTFTLSVDFTRSTPC